MAMAHPVRYNNFAHGLCDCCVAQDGFCRVTGTICCGPCMFGKLVGSLPRFHETGEDIWCAGSCCGACCLYSTMISCGIQGIYHYKVRSGMRRAAGLPQRDFDDFLTAFLFESCALCQELAEVDLRTKMGAPLAAAAAGNAMMAPGQQQMSAQKQIPPMQLANNNYNNGNGYMQ